MHKLFPGPFFGGIQEHAGQSSAAEEQHRDECQLNQAAGLLVDCAAAPQDQRRASHAEHGACEQAVEVRAEADPVDQSREGERAGAGGAQQPQSAATGAGGGQREEDVLQQEPGQRAEPEEAHHALPVRLVPLLHQDLHQQRHQLAQQPCAKIRRFLERLFSEGYQRRFTRLHGARSLRILVAKQQ